MNKIFKRLFIIKIMMSIILSPACRKQTDDFKIYTIKKGEHTCNGWRGSLEKHNLSFKFKFDKSCLYNESELSKTGWNKLVGLSGSVHSNSARIGWRSDGENIILGYYIYINGKRTIEYADTMNINDTGRASINYAFGKVFMTINNHSKVYDSEKPDIMILDYPYFGGESPAPHTMIILIKEL